MADSHPHSHHPIPRRTSPSSPTLDFPPPVPEVVEQIATIENQLVRIEGVQKADHALLTSLNEAVGSSPDAATGAEGRGMRRQLADVATNVAALRREVAELKGKVDASPGGNVTMLGMGKGSTAGTIGSVVAGFMATAIAIVEMLKVAGVLK
jgi:hypothetical protein